MLAALLAALLACAPPGKARADMCTHFGFSPRGIGMANAVSAVIDDYSGVYYNPAALAASGISSFTLGYLYHSPRIKVRDWAGGERAGFTRDMNTGLVGYRQNLKDMMPRKWDRNVMVALALAYPGNFKTSTTVSTSKYDEVQFPVFGRVPDMMVMSGGMGVEVLPGTLYLGASVRLAVTFSAKDIILGIHVLEEQVVYEKVAVDAESEILPIAGILVQPRQDLRLAAVWRRGGSPVRIVGRGGGGASLGPLELPIGLDMAFQDFFVPDEFAGSVAWRPRQNLLLAVECTYARWSKYNDPFGNIPPGEPFEDIVIPRFGVEYMVLQELRLNAGYYWQPSPVKTLQPSTRYLDSDAHVFSLGVGYAVPVRSLLRFPLVVSAYAQFRTLPRRTLYTVEGPTAVWGTAAGLGATVELRF